MCRFLYRSGLDVLMLTAALSWAYAALYKEIPYVPWEYPCAAAACVWCLAVRIRRQAFHPAALLPLLFAASLLTLFTASAFLPYLLPAAWPLFFIIFAGHSAWRQRVILHSSAALASLAPAAFLGFQLSFLGIFNESLWWTLAFFLIFGLNERLLAFSASAYR